MKVKKIILNVCTLLQLDDVKQDLIDETENKDLDLLVVCVNYVNNLIATDYIKIYNKATIKVLKSGLEIPYSNISPHTFIGVVGVYNASGDCVDFSASASGITVNYTGECIVKYAAFPEDVGISDTICDYPIKLNAQIFAYGVAAEYLFIKNVIDDSYMWDTRFKRELQSVTRKLKTTKLPARPFK